MKRIKLVVFFILGLFILASCGSLNHESFPNGPQIEEPGTNPDGEASSYLLTYYENGLKVYQEKLESGKELPQVEATKIPLGYEFIGWSTSEEEYLVVDFNKMPEEDVDLFAHYKKCKYSINFEANIELPVGTTTSIEYEYQDRLGSYIPNDLQEVINQQTEFVFVGWFLDPLFKEEFVEVSMPAHDLTLYAKWQFSGVCFVNGLEVFYEVKGDEGQLINAPVQNPTKPGYDFVGWKDEEGNLVQFPLTITDEVQYIYASYEPKSNVSYKVEHYLENLNGSFVRFEVEDLKASTDQEVEALWKSYTGFTKDEQNENNVLKGNVNYNGSLVLKLYYTRNSYEVSFNTNGGSVIDTVSYKYEQAIAAPSSPNKVGYTFAGWQLNGKDYNFATMPANDIELTAKWQIVEYTVTFVATEVVGKVTYTVENKNIVEPTVPSIEHFTGAWADYELTAGNITVNAVYTPIIYTVTFKAEGKVVDTENYTVVNTTIKEPTVPTKVHYNGAWETYTLISGNVEVNAVYKPVTYYVTFIADGKEVAKLPYNVENTLVTNPTVPAKTHYTGAWETYTLTSGNVEVEAEYTPVTYYVTFIANGVEVAKLPYNVEYTTVVNPVVPAKQHYTGTWETYTLTSGNVEVEAIYTPVTYFVTFIADGIEVAKLPYNVENTLVTNPTVPTKEHYTGVWETYTLTSGNVEVNAIYTINQYTITFDTDGGSIITPITQDYGTTIVAPNNPTKSGYVFKGWSPSLPLVMGGENITLTAIWEELKSTSISFASKDNRTSLSTSKQVWEQAGIIVTNNKNKSTSNVADYSNPARFYKSSDLVIEYPYPIYEIVIECSGESKYYIPSSYKINGAKLTVSGSKATIILDTPTTSLTLSSLPNQIRVSNITIKTAETLKTYSIDFDSNSGSGSIDTISNLEGAKVKLPSSTGLTAPSNMKFSHWNTKSDDSGISYYAGDEVTLTSNLVLYAIWTKNEAVEMTIKEAISEDDGVNVILSGVVQSIDTAWNQDYGNMTVTLKDATGTIQLYRLSTQVNVGDLITVTGKVGSYYGVKQIAQGATAVIDGVLEVTLSYNNNGGSGTISSMSLVAGQNIDLADGTVLTAPTGKEFKGWSTDPSATNPTYGSGDVTTFFENTTLYAIWADIAVEDDTKYFEKVTANQSDWSGTYLIVYEAGKLALDGSRTTVDATSNYKTVTISNNKIEATDDVMKFVVTITKVSGGYTIKTISGYYIGQTTNANGLKSSKSTTYTNTIKINSDGTVNIVSGGAYLRYNAASNQNRFRYYKSSTYTGQKAINLYKLS